MLSRLAIVKSLTKYLLESTVKSAMQSSNKAQRNFIKFKVATDKVVCPFKVGFEIILALDRKTVATSPRSKLIGKSL